VGRKLAQEVITYSVSPHSGTTSSNWPGSSHFRCFMVTLRHATLGRLLWTSNQPDSETCTWQHTRHTRDRHPCPRGIRPAIPPSERLQTHTLDRAVTGTGQEVI